MPSLLLFTDHFPLIPALLLLLFTDHFILNNMGVTDVQKPSQNEGEKKPAGLGRVSEWLLTTS